MSRPLPAARSLGLRLFLLTALVVAVLSAIVVSVTSALGNRIGERTARAAVVSAGLIESALEQEELDQLDLIAQREAEDPYLTAYLADARRQGDRFSVLDILEEREAALGFDFAAALDPRGALLVRTDYPDQTGQDLSQAPLIARAFEESGAAGVWVEGGTMRYAVAAPLTVNQILEGLLVLGFTIDDSVALEMKRTAGSEIALFVRSPETTGFRLVATTLDLERSQELTQRLEEIGDPSASGRDEVLDLRLTGERWLARPRMLAGNPATLALSLTSLDAELASYRSISRLQALIALAGTIAAASLIYWFIRRSLAPMKELTASMERAAVGALDHQPAGTDREDEIGLLARAFDSLLSELRERRETQHYLAEIARSMPTARRAAPRASPTDTTVLVGDESTGAGSGPRPTGGLLRAGEFFGERFEVLDVLGEGGMGIVYQARDTELHEIVALKTVKSALAEPRFLERLKSELRLARRITHPNVLRTFDFGEIDDTAFISMEYVHGVTLRELLDRSGRLPYSAGLLVARQLCRGLGAAHAEEVLHRDIKPDNLLLEPTGNVKLTDFGLAQPVRRSSEEEAEDAGKILGTPGYISPEQLQGKEADARSDIFATGVVLYELFTGERPFPKPRSVAAMVEQSVVGEPKPPQEAWSEIPDELADILLRCLARDPAERIQSVDELLGAIDRLRT